MQQFVNNKLDDLENGKQQQKINKGGLLVSYDFNKLYPSAQVDKNSTWPAIETSYFFKKYMNESVCEIFNNEKWDNINRSACSTVEYHNPECLIFQQIPLKKMNNSYKNSRFEEIN